MTIYGIHKRLRAGQSLLAELGPRNTGKACLYVKRLDGIDLEVVERLIRDAWKALNY